MPLRIPDSLQRLIDEQPTEPTTPLGGTFPPIQAQQGLPSEGLPSGGLRIPESLRRLVQPELLQQPPDSGLRGQALDSGLRGQAQGMIQTGYQPGITPTLTSEGFLPSFRREAQQMAAGLGGLAGSIPIRTPYEVLHGMGVLPTNDFIERNIPAPWDVVKALPQLPAVLLNEYKLTFTQSPLTNLRTRPLSAILDVASLVTLPTKLLLLSKAGQLGQWANLVKSGKLVQAAKLSHSVTSLYNPFRIHRVWDREGQILASTIPGEEGQLILSIPDAWKDLADGIPADVAAATRSGAEVQQVIHNQRRSVVAHAREQTFNEFVTGGPIGDESTIYAKGLTREAMEDLHGEVSHLVRRQTAPLPTSPGTIQVYHGSPREFDQFSLQGIGTGEGTQAFGWGLYFSENPEIAGFYQSKLGPQVGQGAFYQASLLMADGKTVEESIIVVQRMKASSSSTEELARWTAVEDAIRQGNYRPSRFYEVEIAGDVREFLQWESPMAQQNEAIRQVASELSDIRPDDSGKYMYRQLTKQLGSQEAASRHLASREVPGIRYRSNEIANATTFNYVLFDTERLSIPRSLLREDAIRNFGLRNFGQRIAQTPSETGSPVAMTRAETLREAVKLLPPEQAKTMTQYLNAAAAARLNEWGLTKRGIPLVEGKPYVAARLSDGKTVYFQAVFSTDEAGNVTGTTLGNAMSIVDPRRRKESVVIRETERSALVREAQANRALVDWAKGRPGIHQEPPPPAGVAGVVPGAQVTEASQSPIHRLAAIKDEQGRSIYDVSVLEELDALRESGAIDAETALMSAQARLLKWSNAGTRTFIVPEKLIAQARVLGSGILRLNKDAQRAILDTFSVRYRLPAYVSEALFRYAGDMMKSAPTADDMRNIRGVLASLIDRRTLPKDVRAQARLFEDLTRLMGDLPDTFPQGTKGLVRERPVTRLPLPQARPSESWITRKLFPAIGIPNKNLWTTLGVGMDVALKREAPEAGSAIVKGLTDFFYNWRSHQSQLDSRFRKILEPLTTEERLLVKPVIENTLDRIRVPGAARMDIVRAAASEVTREFNDVFDLATSRGIEIEPLANYFPHFFERNADIAANDLDSFLASIDNSTTLGDLGAMESVRTNVLSAFYAEGSGTRNPYHDSYFQSARAIADAVLEGSRNLGFQMGETEALNLVTRARTEPGALEEVVRKAKAAYVNQLPSLNARSIFDNYIANRGHMASPHLEMPRKLNLRGEVEDTSLGLSLYSREVSRRIAMAEAFGPDLARLNQLIRRVGLEGGNEDFALQIVNRILGRQRDLSRTEQKFETFAGPARSFAVISHLALAGAQNLTQLHFGAFRTSYVAAAKATGKMLKSLVSEDARHELLKLISDSGAIPFVREGKIRMRDLFFSDVADEYYKDYVGINTSVNKYARWFLIGTGFTPSERFNRIVSAIMGEEYLKSQLNRALKYEGATGKGGKLLYNHAVKELKALLDTPDSKLSLQPAELTDKLIHLARSHQGKVNDLDELGAVGIRAKARAALKVVDDSQFGVTGKLKLPYYWASPYGQFFFQFKTFAFHSAQFFKREIQRNPQKAFLMAAPGFAAFGGVQGALWNYGMEAIYNREHPETYKEKYLQGFFQLGMFGMYMNMVRAATNRGWGVSNLVVPPSVMPITRLTVEAASSIYDQGEWKGLSKVEKERIDEAAWRFLPITGIFAARRAAERGQGGGQGLGLPGMSRLKGF